MGFVGAWFTQEIFWIMIQHLSILMLLEYWGLSIKKDVKKNSGRFLLEMYFVIIYIYRYGNYNQLVEKNAIKSGPEAYTYGKRLIRGV